MSSAPKISIIGAGNVGATAAMRIAERGIADVVLLDIAGNVARGKALDIKHALSFTKSQREIIGTDDYRDIKSSKIVVVCAGFARRPGMSREDLITKNADVIKGVAASIKIYAPSSIIIMVTNPLDIMTYLAYKVSGFPKNRVIGMAGLLDSGRFISLIANELKVESSCVRAIIIGLHSDTMIPLVNYTTVKGRPIKKIISQQRLNKLIDDVRASGSKVVSLLGAGSTPLKGYAGAPFLGSAYFAPSAAITEMVECILKDKRKVIPSSCYLSGEYGLSDIYIGVPARIGKNGIIDIVELKLEGGEKLALKNSAENLKKDLTILEI